MPIHGLQPSSAQVYPPHFDIEAVIRPNILSLHPYRCARDDYQSGILLDANENALGHSIPSIASSEEAETFDKLSLNRYPDPMQSEIKTLFANLRGLSSPDHVFLGVGSDEVVDLLMRVCCVPSKEKVLICPPTYGMYSVCAQVNDLKVVKVSLETEGGAFQLRLNEIQKAVANDPSIKLVFLCSPGNPTGTLVPLSDIIQLLEDPNFKGIVIVDEAYIDFSGDDASAVSLVKKYANLCVLQTLSKAFGLAAIRLGFALAQPPLIQVLTNTKAPYNISSLTASLALRALSPEGLTLMHEKVRTLLSSRAALLSALGDLKPLGVGDVLGGNHANFIVLPILDKQGGARPDNGRALQVYKRLAEERGVVIRYRGTEVGCEGCVRITVGAEEENRVLLERLAEVLKEV